MSGSRVGMAAIGQGRRRYRRTWRWRNRARNRQAIPAPLSSAMRKRSRGACLRRLAGPARSRDDSPAARRFLMTRRPVLEFWYEFASTYSYLAAMRIEPLAEAAGVDIRWRPFLLGPIFAAQGWTSSPFNLFPAKGRYMWRDMERQAAALGLPFNKPDPFPQNGLIAARVALYGADHPWGPT